jgi:hypothetical protein
MVPRIVCLPLFGLPFFVFASIWFAFANNQGCFRTNVLWRIVEEQTKLDAFLFTEYIDTIVHFVGHTCRLRCIWIGQHTLQIGPRVTIKSDKPDCVPRND